MSTDASELDRAVVELEGATARLSLALGSESGEVEEAIKRRATAIEWLFTLTDRSPGAVHSSVLRRLKEDFRRGNDLRVNLLLRRGATQAELRQAGEARSFARMLGPGAAASRGQVNSTG